MNHTSPAITEVIITEVNMSIGAMCKFMVKWAIAAIPVFILAVIGFVVSAIFGVGRSFNGILVLRPALRPAPEPDDLEREVWTGEGIAVS